MIKIKPYLARASPVMRLSKRLVKAFCWRPVCCPSGAHAPPVIIFLKAILKVFVYLLL